MVEPVSDYLFIISLRKLRTGAHSIALFTAFSANDSEDFFFHSYDNNGNLPGYKAQENFLFLA